MIMKTKHVKNTGQMNKGQIEKLPWWGKGGKRGKLPEGAKNEQGGGLPLLPHSYSPALIITRLVINSIVLAHLKYTNYPANHSW